jgi:hypothetical protein
MGSATALDVATAETAFVIAGPRCPDASPGI